MLDFGVIPFNIFWKWKQMISYVKTIFNEDVSIFLKHHKLFDESSKWIFMIYLIVHKQ